MISESIQLGSAAMMAVTAFDHCLSLVRISRDGVHKNDRMHSNETLKMRVVDVAALKPVWRTGVECCRSATSTYSICIELNANVL
jgi:hypothetical protein